MKRFCEKTLTIIFLVFLALPTYVFAQTAVFKSTKIQAFQINYSGELEKSFTGGQFGLGVEAYLDYGRSWGRLYSKARGTQVAGSQDFLDGSTSTACSYVFYQGQFETGIVLFPIPPRTPGLGLFLSVGGTLGYNWLSLTSDSTFTTLKPSESALSSGYAAGLGVEWTLSKGVGKRHVLTGEINYRVERASLGGQSSFDLSGLSIHAGYGW